MCACACRLRRRRRRRAADVHVRDAGAVRGLAAQQAAAGRAGRLPAGARAQGNAARAPLRRAPHAPPDAALVPPALPALALPSAPSARRLAAAAPPQLPGRFALPQLLLTRRAPRPLSPPLLRFVFCFSL